MEMSRAEGKLQCSMRAVMGLGNRRRIIVITLATESCGQGEGSLIRESFVWEWSHMQHSEHVMTHGCSAGHSRAVRQLPVP
jgi:hypothetical protein